MKSAYGRQTSAPDYELTCVEPGSPMGELMRRYWQPVCTSDELRDLPRKEKLLCEEIVVFRDKKGRVGALDPHCAHRGTSLEWGRVEEEGLRCCYHGWLYDTQGQCIEMPCETEEFRKAMDVWQPAYPVTEYGGLVFVYMGPPGTEPLFPRFDIIDPDRGEDVVLRGMRLWGDYAVGMVKDCNWLQHYENIVDPYHLLMLHQWISGDQFEGALMQGKTTIAWEKTPLGVRYNVIKDLPNGNRMVRHAECIVPNMFIIPSIREPGTAPKRKQRGTELSWAVPIDNEHVRGISIVAWPLENGEPKPDWKPGTDTIADIRPGSFLQTQLRGAPAQARRSRSARGAAPDRDPRARKPGAFGYRHRHAAAAFARAAAARRARPRPDQHHARSVGEQADPDRRLEHDPVAGGSCRIAIQRRPLTLR